LSKGLLGAFLVAFAFCGLALVFAICCPGRAVVKPV